MKINNQLLKIGVFLCFGIIFQLTTNAQIHRELQNEGNISFKDIVRQSEQFFDKIGRGKGVGYKQFQRWQYWASRSLDDRGMVRGNYEAYNAYKRFASQNASVQRSFDTTEYLELGPLTSQYTSTWSSGLGRVSAIGLDPNNDNHIIVGSPTGGIWKTTNLGASWAPLFDDQALIDVYGLEISHSNSNHYFAGLSRGMVRSIDGGNSWSSITSVDTSDLYNTITMHPTDANIIFAVGQYRGKVFKSTNGGSSFSQVLDITTDLFDLEFHPTNPNIIYVSGEDRVYKSTDGGNNFTQITTGPWNGSGNIIMMAVTPAAPNNIYALEEQDGGFNALYLSTDSGETWSTLDAYDGTNNIMGYDQDVQSGQAPRDMDIIVSPLDSNIIHVAGVETWRSSNLGQTWSKTTVWNNPGGSNFIHADIDLLIYDGNRIVAGTDGGIYYSTNDATSWTDISEGLAIRQFYRIGASQTDADRVSGGSQDNGTGTLVNGVWRDWLGADGMETFIDWNNADIIYGTSQRGTFYKSTDGGISRSSISNSPPTGNWVTPFEQDPLVASTIYAATDEVYKSTNGGGSWSAISNFSNGDLADEMKISSVDPNYIYVSYGTNFYTTEDGGSNWTVNPIPAGSRVNYITPHPSDATRLAIAVSGSSSKVWESTNSGTSWTNITGNIPSAVSIECVLYDETADGGFYAGGNPGVYYSDTAGNSNYTNVSKNLPNVRVTELEIRNQVLYVGTYGRGLWKFEFSCDGSLTGQSCDDFDDCTENDVYDANCNCAGTPVGDADNDGVCDTEDQCPGFDDSIDVDLDGIPDGCDSSINCNSCEGVISDFPHVEDFENGEINICQLASDDIDWTILSGSTPSSGTGPSAAQSGSNYFYIEASDPNFPTKAAIFKGACYNTENTSSISINFWYHMYGANVNELKLDISTDGGSNYTTIWTKTGNQGDQWVNENIDLSAYASAELTYTFSAITGSDWQSDIAVDAITIDATPSACINNGGDADNDGICADLDCDDNDPNIGGEGSSCDDGDDCTENDVLDADCNCVGTIIIADTDGDGILDCLDQEINSTCPQNVDANGVSIDSDNDGTPDCIDNCDNDPSKTEPGDCGCGIEDIDTDSDGILDCNDQEINSPCPQNVDANGISIDTDNDGIADCEDTCNGNIDTDGDGILDCNDQEINSTCPQNVDANGISIDTDNDGTPDCIDNCANDPNKIEPGDCGCGVEDLDTDNDGVLDCNDQEINSPCPQNVDINGISIDTDNDGSPDCIDNCDNDPNKIEPGDCGCGVEDIDTDNDGVLDCNDQEINSPCPQDVDANGVSNDSDGDGICDVDDICANGDDSIDSDGDGIPDACDNDCTPTTTNFSVNQLSHSGTGSSTTSLTLSGGTHRDISFTISELNSRLGGKPSNRFDERVTISYVNGNGQTQTYGTFTGSTINNITVSISAEVQSINIVLSDAYDGNSSTTMRITLSQVSSCVALNCIDSDGDGVCDTEDICPNFDDNLIGTPCDDGDSCTINDVYTTDCDCAGTFSDSDNDGVCDGDDVCPGGNDNIDSDGDGIPDFCECSAGIGNFSSNTLNHSGSGSSSISFNFPAVSRNITFSITNLNAVVGGRKNNRYIEVVSIQYRNASGSIQNYGSFRGNNQSSVNVQIAEDITEIIVNLTDGFDGNSPSISVNLSSIDYCAETPQADNNPQEQTDEDSDLISNNSSFSFNEMRIFPNPAKDKLNLELSNVSSSYYTIEVKSILGQAIYQNRVKVNNQSSTHSITTQDWKDGIYFVILSVDNKTLTRKVIIRK